MSLLVQRAMIVGLQPMVEEEGGDLIEGKIKGNARYLGANSQSLGGLRSGEVPQDSGWVGCVEGPQGVLEASY